MDRKRAIWIKDPLAILADGAERGIVVENGKIVELVPKGGQPATSAAFSEAGDHVVLPGLINTHHHFYQDRRTRTRRRRSTANCFHGMQALYPARARPTPENLDLGVTVAMSELLLSGCTTTTDHHPNASTRPRWRFPGDLRTKTPMIDQCPNAVGLD